MFWRLPAPVRSLICSSHRRFYSENVSNRASNPLKILFCGSDEFSIASLRALTAAKRDVPRLIDSIDVVHRPAKPSGRGLKHLREGTKPQVFEQLTLIDQHVVPIKQVATEELNLPTHTLDTFTGWTPPIPINLIVAVSFGLFVPPRLLNLAQYGGVNVHPSLLPDLRGPAPIEHAILRRREYTGVSIQTLHPQQFDQGTILAQTSVPGTHIPWGTTAQCLEAQLAESGAKMLVEVLKSRKFVPRLQDAGWYAQSNGARDHAPKITKQDRYIDFAQSTLDDLLAVQYALGDPWCILPHGNRLIIHKVIDTGLVDRVGAEPGVWVHKDCPTHPLWRDAMGKIGFIIESTYAGGKARSGNAKLLRMLPKEDSTVDIMSWQGYQDLPKVYL